MKKILSILLCLSLVIGMVFAQDATVADALTVEASGSASLTWGIDLGDSDLKLENYKHGFFNDTNLKIKIPFFNNEKAFSGGSADKNADVYADLNFNVKPGTSFKVKDTKEKEKTSAGNLKEVSGYDVDAKLVFFGAYIQVYNKPFFGSEYAIGWDPINMDEEKDRHNWANPEFAGFGGKIGYANKDFMDLDVALKFGSNKNWKKDSYPADKDKPEKSAYALGLDFHMQPVEKYFSIDATVNSTLAKGNVYKSGELEGDAFATNFGVKLGSEPIDSLKFGLGFDGSLTGDKDKPVAWDIGFTTEYKWINFALYTCSEKNDKNTYDTINLASHLGFKSEDSGDTNFVPGLAFDFAVNAYDLLGKKKGAYTPATKETAANKDWDDGLKAYLESNKGATEAEYKADPAGHTKWLAKLAEDKANEDFKATNRAEYDGAMMPIGLKLGVSYKANITDSMWIKPFANLYGETNHFDEGNTKDTYFGMAYDVGLTFAPIEKAEITAKWAQGKLNADTYEGGWNGDYMIDAAAVKKHNGTFTLGIKLIF